MKTRMNKFASNALSCSKHRLSRVINNQVNDKTIFVENKRDQFFFVYPFSKKKMLKVFYFYLTTTSIHKGPIFFIKLSYWEFIITNDIKLTCMN